MCLVNAHCKPEIYYPALWRGITSDVQVLHALLELTNRTALAREARVSNMNKMEEGIIVQAHGFVLDLN